MAIGADQPEFLLTGQPLADQGLVVAGMLLEGWTPDQLRQIVAGRPLPPQIKTTVGAVVSGRIREALRNPAPSTVRGADDPSVSVGVATIPVIPMQCCDDCGLGFRAPDPGLCRGCREDVTT
ncbi:hypothetical protein ACFQ0G_53185 [Streptomyces chiangmaiensis]